MWFIFNIAMLVIFIITRIFCIFTTFKVLKYDEYFYEANPVIRKILDRKNGKILLIFLSFMFLFVFMLLNFIMNVICPEVILGYTILVFIISPFLVYDFVINLIPFRDNRKVKSEVKVDNKKKEIEVFENFKEILKKLYFRIKREVIEKGYLEEIEWVNNIPNIKNLNKTLFFREYVWVVISSGIKNQVAEKIFKNFWIDNITFNFDAIKHPNKNKAIKKVYNRLDFYFDHFLKSKNELLFLKNLPHIGDITKYHLARNLGLNYAKPDRHLVRITNLFGYNNVQKFCKKVSELTQDKIGLVDLVFWRFANITENYLEIIENWIKEVNSV